ncbi:MAG: hypothetical protein ABI821_06300 [Pseudomonadota bacterium]
MSGDCGTPVPLTTESVAMLHTPNGRWFTQVWFVPSCNCAMSVATNGGGDRAETAIFALDGVLRERLLRSP